MAKYDVLPGDFPPEILDSLHVRNSAGSPDGTSITDNAQERRPTVRSNY